MAIKKVAYLSCDHVNNGGENCTVERAQNKIDSTQPMYRVQIVLEQIIPEGTTEIVKEDVILCYWDLYHHLSAYHERARGLVTKFKEQEERRQGAMNNDE